MLRNSDGLHKDRPQLRVDSDGTILSGTLCSGVHIFKRKKKDRGSVAFWAFVMIGICVYAAAIIDNYGNWKAMTLFLIAGLFGLLGLAHMVLKIIKRVKEIQRENLEIKAKVLWLERINIFE